MPGSRIATWSWHCSAGSAAPPLKQGRLWRCAGWRNGGARIWSDLARIVRSGNICAAATLTLALAEPETGLGEVKRLRFAPDARGHGRARRRMTTIETQARNLGLQHLSLDTNAVLPEAIALYTPPAGPRSPPVPAFPPPNGSARGCPHRPLDFPQKNRPFPANPNFSQKNCFRPGAKSRFPTLPFSSYPSCQGRGPCEW